MPEFFAFIWDDGEGGNIAHLAEHGVNPDEAEQVITACFADRERSRSQPEYWLVQGPTRAGRFLIVVFEYDSFGHVVNPVTAYEPEGR